MFYRADETAEQKTFKLQALEFVRLAAKRARERARFRSEVVGVDWDGQPNEDFYERYAA